MGTVEKVGKPEYFARDRKADKKGSEEGFFAQQEGKGAQKKEVSSARAEDQKKVTRASSRPSRRRACSTSTSSRSGVCGRATSRTRWSSKQLASRTRGCEEDVILCARVL